MEIILSRYLTAEEYEQYKAFEQGYIESFQAVAYKDEKQQEQITNALVNKHYEVQREYYEKAVNNFCERLKDESELKNEILFYLDDFSREEFLHKANTVKEILKNSPYKDGKEDSESFLKEYFSDTPFCFAVYICDYVEFYVDVCDCMDVPREFVYQIICDYANNVYGTQSLKVEDFYIKVEEDIEAEVEEDEDNPIEGQVSLDIEPIKNIQIPAGFYEADRIIANDKITNDLMYKGVFGKRQGLWIYDKTIGKGKTQKTVKQNVWYTLDLVNEHGEIKNEIRLKNGDEELILKPKITPTQWDIFTAVGSLIMQGMRVFTPQMIIKERDGNRKAHTTEEDIKLIDATLSLFNYSKLTLELPYKLKSEPEILFVKDPLAPNLTLEGKRVIEPNTNTTYYVFDAPILSTIRGKEVTVNGVLNEIVYEAQGMPLLLRNAGTIGQLVRVSKTALNTKSRKTDGAQNLREFILRQVFRARAGNGDTTTYQLIYDFMGHTRPVEQSRDRDKVISILEDFTASGLIKSYEIKRKGRKIYSFTITTSHNDKLMGDY